jgi:hypothetical protein
MFWLNKHARHRNNLSPYVDGHLKPLETAALEAHLAACEPCRHELEGLRATVAAVRDLPQLETPRSFAVTPQMLERRRAVARLPSTPPFAIGMRMASAAIAVVLAVVVIGDVSEGGNGVGGDGARLESASESRDTTELAAGADAEQANDEPDAAAPAATGIGEQYDARATDEVAPSTPAENLSAACPAFGDQMAADAGASAATPAPNATPQPAPSATVDSNFGSGGAGAGPATGICDEKSIAANQDSGSASPPAAITDDEAPDAAALSAGDDDSISTLRVIEIVLAGSLIVLVAGVAADFALRRRRSI